MRTIRDDIKVFDLCGGGMELPWTGEHWVGGGRLGIISGMLNLICQFDMHRKVLVGI